MTLASGDLKIAQAIARSIRESSGGLAAVQARGFLTADPEVVQVSMNLLDTRRTSLVVVFERIRAEAAARGVEVLRKRAGRHGARRSAGRHRSRRAPV